MSGDEKLSTLMVITCDRGDMSRNKAIEYSQEVLNLRFIVLPSSLQISFITHSDDGKIEYIKSE